jgi:hypothetical protein
MFNPGKLLLSNLIFYIFLKFSLVPTLARSSMFMLAVVGSKTYLKAYARLEILTRDKHLSLFGLFVGNKKRTSFLRQNIASQKVLKHWKQISDERSP